jgi:hypothetical protein
MRCIPLALKIGAALLCCLINPTLEQMTFPAHVGGFAGHTEIHQMVYDTSYNYGIAGISWDTAIVTTANSNFLMYLNQGGNVWLWKKQFGCSASADPVTAMAMNANYVTVLTASTLLLVLDKNGDIIR